MDDFSDLYNTAKMQAEERMKAACKKIKKKFKNDKDATEEILKYVYAEEPRACNSCKSLNVRCSYGSKFGKCLDCGKKVHLMAGTFFEKMKKPLAWLTAILLTEDGIIFNANQFASVVDIAYSTAWSMLKKVAVVLNQSLTLELGVSCLRSSLFILSFRKRSSETPAKQHPLAEQEAFEKESGEVGISLDWSDFIEPSLDPLLGGQSVPSQQPRSQTGDKELKGSQLEGLEKIVYDVCGIEPVHFEEIANLANLPIGSLGSVLISLELFGYIESLPGDFYKKSESSINADAKKVFASENSEAIQELITNAKVFIEAFIDFIHVFFHGISRKYLQLYLARFWAVMDRQRWGGGRSLLLNVYSGENGQAFRSESGQF